MIYTLLEILFCVIDMIYLDIFLNKILEGRVCKHRYIKYVYIILFGLAIHICTKFEIYTNISNTLCLVLMVAYGVFIFKDKIQNKILASILFNIILGVITTMVLNLIVTLTDKDLSDLLSFCTNQRIMIVMIIKAVIFMIIKLAQHLILFFRFSIPNKYKYMLLLLFVTFCISIGISFEISLINGKYKVNSYISFILISFIIFNIAILILLKQISVYFKEEATKSIILKSEMNMKKSMLEMEKKQQEIDKIKHDMLSHYGILEYLVKNEDKEQTLEYIKELKTVIKDTKKYYKTGNTIVDAVINQKLQLGEEYAICFDLRIYIPKDIEIKPIDLGAILSNLLDNAIEAAREVPPNNRKININIHPHNENLLIDISNTVATNPVKGDKLIRRQKKNYNEHGYGMQIIKHIVEQYDGYMDYKCNNNIFSIAILIKYKMLNSL